MVCECLRAMISNTHKSTGNLKKRIKINIKYTHAFELLFFFIYQNLKLLGACVAFFKRIVYIFLRLFVFNCRWTNKEPNYVSSINERQPNWIKNDVRTAHCTLTWWKQMIYLVICLKLVELKHKFHILSDKFIRQQEASDTHNSAIN